MRVLILADVHANWAALEAVSRERFDLCLCLGDLVDYGPDPGPCIDWVRRNALCTVRGNHDHCVAQNVPTAGDSGFRYLSTASRPISLAISEQDRRFLARLPLSKFLRIDGKVLLLVHATPRDPLDEYLFGDSHAWERRLEGVEADIVCVGHTHHPFRLEFGPKTVLNPGSVGQPRDGDPRASYAILDNGRIELKRVDYPIDETIERLQESSMPQRAKAMAAAVLRAGQWRPEFADAAALIGCAD